MDFLSPVLTSEQMQRCDAYTIEHEPISSFDLMERASLLLSQKIQHFSPHTTLHILCGPGNNGGDGYCIGRYLSARGYNIRISDCSFGKQCSSENLLAQKLWLLKRQDAIKRLEKAEDIVIDNDEVIVDCILGTGLKSALTGHFQKLVNIVNSTFNYKISIDIPTGLFDSSAQGGSVYLKTDKTISIQSAKPSFFYAENQIDFDIADVGIDVDKIQTKMHFLLPTAGVGALSAMIPSKSRFSHKGNYGHAVLVGGNNGMTGAIAIAAKSCVESGAGKTTVLAPAAAKLYLGAIPEVMQTNVKFSKNAKDIVLPAETTVLGIGPGLGCDANAMHFLTQILNQYDAPVLLDADALNLISQNPQIWKSVKAGSIITPHPKEFNRLFGSGLNGAEKYALAKEKAKELGIYILAKDTYTALYCPDGSGIFNGTGGGWLAQGGSGDRLTGIIAGYWSRTGCAKTACMAGMYAAGLKDFSLNTI